MGDVVHTLPAVADLRRHWPESEIAWLINPEWEPLIAENPAVDRVLVFPRRDFRGLSGWIRFFRWLIRLPYRRPDLALDFQGLFRTALIARGLGSRWLAGMSDAREGATFFYHQTVPIPPQPPHSVERYRSLVHALGVPISAPPEFSLPLGKKIEHPLPARFLLLHPFSRGAGKSLSQPDVVSLCQQLAPLPVVLVGSEKIDAPLPDHVIDLLGKTTLSELIWLIREAAFTVSVDSGPMHLAAALTDRLLSIHTWSNPLSVGPYRPSAWIWKNEKFLRMAEYQSASNESVQAPTPPATAAFLRERLREVF